MIRKILAAIDDSGAGARAGAYAADLAAQLGAQLVLLNVIDPSRSLALVPALGRVNQSALDDAREKAEYLLDRQLKKFRRKTEAQKLVVEGDPAREIIDTAAKIRADVIVIGTDKRSRISHLVLGSVADEVIQKAVCPVLTIRGEAAKPLRTKRARAATAAR